MALILMQKTMNYGLITHSLGRYYMNIQILNLVRPQYASDGEKKLREGGEMKKRISFISFLLFLPTLCWAGELVLVKGKGVPVCEAHFKNLKDLNLFRMVCGRDEYYPEQNGITRQEWEELDLKDKDNKELFIRMEKFFTYGNQYVKNDDLDNDNKLERFKPFASSTLNIANVDIANNGKKETIAIYSQGLCMESTYNARPIAIIDGQSKQVDIEKTKPLLQNISKPGYDLKAEAQESMFRLYDVFIYKDITYFDKWFIYDWSLTVYMLSKDKTKEICKYKYRKTN
jgi:hypothetical protein